MNDLSYEVYVIVDPHFGSRLREIPIGKPVWIADTPVNHPAFWTIAKERNITDHLIGLTSFVVDANTSPENWLISQIETIDLHHGEMSHDPPWSTINVIGIRWSKQIQEELARFGFKQHDDMAEGFIARK